MSFNTQKGERQAFWAELTHGVALRAATRGLIRARRRVAGLGETGFETPAKSRTAKDLNRKSRQYELLLDKARHSLLKRRGYLQGLHTLLKQYVLSSAFTNK